jgi:CRISPR-associated protein (TIGR03985 family)
VLQERLVEIITYPVCLHYMRRAKYLSAYGIDPHGNFGWHNYRLDRIAAKSLQILAWGDPLIPKLLKELWRTGNLPTPDEIQAELDEAWGFNFYYPKGLLIVRFPPQFARWYVDDTVRHPTFEPIAYQQLLQLIRQQVKGSQQQQLLSIIQQRPTTDAYYKAWIRLGDINVLMRLRDWRPNGEVIAPLSVRQKLLEEALQEVSHYQDF